MKMALLLGALLAGPVAGDSLSEAERQALLEKLDELRDGAKSRADNRHAAAKGAFRAAIESPSAAVAFYLQCAEKIEFEEQNRDSQDFREWRRKQEERLKDPRFGEALRQQLNWLLLSLEAAETPDEKRAELAPQAAQALETLFANADQLRGQVKLLSENVHDTVFAKAYDLHIRPAKGWPAAPLPVETVFNDIILPPLVARQDSAGIRAAWNRRLQYEALIHERLSGARGGGSSAALARFLAERRPQLLWEMEEDVYESGDQRGAALQMLKHLETFLGHPDARTWETRFREFVAPPEEGEAAEVPGEAS